MYAHGEDDIREPVYDLISPPDTAAEENNNAGADTGTKKIAIGNKQTYRQPENKTNGILFYALNQNYLHY